MSSSLLITAEGHGEVEACGRLVARTLKAQGHIPHVFNTIPPPRRFKVEGPGQLETACEFARTQRPAALLVTSDWEDGCPATDAKPLADRVRTLGLPFPVAVVLFYREYETLALSIAQSLAGKTMHLPTGALQLSPTVPPLADPEGPRGAKEWVRQHLFNGRAYKPTTHQLPLTKLMDPADLRAADLPSYRRLERGLDHLARNVMSGGTAVYP